MTTSIFKPPTTILVHGVGMSPDHFLLIEVNLTSPTVTWTRPGYDENACVPSFEDQVNQLGQLVSAHAPAVVVGVSGGATLALAAAIANPDGLRLAICHEPLVGANVPELDAIVNASAHTLNSFSQPNPAALATFFQRLYGASWMEMPEPFRKWADRNALAIGNDVAHFASFQPDLDLLRTTRTKVVTTVGSTSQRYRHAVAELLANYGVTVHQLPETSHLATVEAPEAFSAVINTELLNLFTASAQQ